VGSPSPSNETKVNGKRGTCDFEKNPSTRKHVPRQERERKLTTTSQIKGKLERLRNQSGTSKVVGGQPRYIGEDHGEKKQKSSRDTVKLDMVQDARNQTAVKKPQPEAGSFHPWS